MIGGSSYYGGSGTGEISWGCIMGGAYFRNVVKFCIGDYPGANNQEDQVAIITSNVPLRTQSAGNSLSTATPLTITNGKLKFSGIIRDYRISNFFKLNNVQGPISLAATTYRRNTDTLGNNLCLGLRVLDAPGNVITNSANPQSCSETLTTSSLPLGTYIIELYPVGNSITPFSVYGSMGQYDLSGTASTGTSMLQISPPYTTLTLQSTMSFDANDTVRVSGGVPPYTFSAKINSFSVSGTTYTYRASKTGLDTITVTDSTGAKASVQVTVSHVDFGGMYGYSWARNYPNPLTGTLGCPAGYTSQPIMGTFNVDYPLYYCYRLHANGVPANYDFGGTFSYSALALRANPVTGGASCPSGYSSVQVFGDTANSQDYKAFMCYKTHNESIEEAAHFGGMYSPGGNGNYNNPATGTQSCPAGWRTAMMLGTPSLDYPLYFCY